MCNTASCSPLLLPPSQLISISAVVATSVLIHEGISDEHVLVVTTVATGMLWCSIVGFISNWWYGMAYFTGSILKVGSL